MLDHSLFIDSAWRPAAGGKTFSLANPATEQRFGRVVDASEADVDAAVKEARTDFDNGSWPRMTPRERAGALETDSGELARRVTMEEGFQRADAIGGTKAMLGVLRYYAELADGLDLVEIRKRRTGVTARIEEAPVGVVSLIVPWNGPIVMAAFNLPSAPLSGCTS